MDGVLTSNRQSPVWVDIPDFSLFHVCGGTYIWALSSLSFGGRDLRYLGGLLTAGWDEPLHQAARDA